MFNFIGQTYCRGYFSYLLKVVCLLLLFFTSLVFDAKVLKANSDRVASNQNQDDKIWPSATDGVPYFFQTKGEVIGIGDLQGGFRELVQILLDLRLIDSNFQWTGGNKHIVINGDFVGGKKTNKTGSRYTMELLMRLSSQAELKGGGVHAIIGNQELYMASGDLSKMSEGEQKKFTKYKENPEDAEFRSAYSAIKKSKFGRWLEGLNQFVVINDLLFVHAGIDPRTIRNLPNFQLHELNSRLREWIRYWLSQPDLESSWIVGQNLTSGKQGQFQTAGNSSPSFYRGFRLDGNQTWNLTGAPELDEMIDFLDGHKLKRMITAHNPLPDSIPIVDHPRYRDRFVMMDTKISNKKNGNITAVIFKSSGRAAIRLFPRTEISKIVKGRFISSLKNSCSNLFPPTSEPL